MEDKESTIDGVFLRRSVRLVGLRHLQIFFLVALLILLSGCDAVDVADEISQSQANQIVAVLNEHGIASQATKESGGRGRYTVSVRKGYYAQAVTILNEKGLPGEPEPSFAETIASRGLLPNSREIESLRVDRALAIEIEEMLRTHPQIASVKAVVRLNFLKESAEPGVSVVLQERNGEKIAPEEVVEIVMRAVPGVKAERIYVHSLPPQANVILKDDEGVENSGGRVLRVPLVPFLFFWRLPEDDLTGISLTIFFGIVLVAALGAFLGYWFGYIQQSRRFFDGELPEVTTKPLRIDRGKREGGEP